MNAAAESNEWGSPEQHKEKLKVSLCLLLTDGPGMLAQAPVLESVVKDDFAELVGIGKPDFENLKQSPETRRVLFDDFDAALVNIKNTVAFLCSDNNEFATDAAKETYGAKGRLADDVVTEIKGLEVQFATEDSVNDDLRLGMSHPKHAWHSGASIIANKAQAMAWGDPDGMRYIEARAELVQIGLDLAAEAEISIRAGYERERNLQLEQLWKMHEATTPLYDAMESVAGDIVDSIHSSGAKIDKIEMVGAQGVVLDKDNQPVKHNKGSRHLTTSKPCLSSADLESGVRFATKDILIDVIGVDSGEYSIRVSGDDSSVQFDNLKEHTCQTSFVVVPTSMKASDCLKTGDMNMVAAIGMDR